MDVLSSSALLKEVQWWWCCIHRRSAVSGDVKSQRPTSFLLFSIILTVNFALGWLLRSWMIARHDMISTSINTSMAKISSELATALEWLDDWPVGLKLNTPLSHFLSVHFQEALHVWQNYLPTGSTICTMVESGMSLGLSSGVALISDVFSGATLHISACYCVSRLIFTWQKSTLHSLWNLFRGKRWNVLRKRTDSYEYEVDQLFLGTLLFTVSAFLFPTVLTYHLLFTGLYAAGSLTRLGLSLPILLVHRYTT